MSDEPPPKRLKRTHLYALGSNGLYQLGLPHANDISRPERCHFFFTCSPPGVDQYVDFIPLQPGEHIKKLVAGGNHTVLLTTFGRVWNTGIGDGSCDTSNVPGTTATRQGEVGSISDGKDNEQRKQGWTVLPWTGRGDAHSLDHTANTASTSQITKQVEVVDIAATFTTTILVTATQQILTYGIGNKGELGLGSSTTAVSTPQKCFDLRAFEPNSPHSHATHISACMSHIVVASSTGAIYGWGASRHGQLGEALKAEKVVWKPRRLELHMRRGVDFLVTGRDFTFVVWKSDGDLKQYFLGEKGRIGIEETAIPLVEDDEVDGKQPNRASCAVYAGWTSLSVVSPAGAVRSYGRRRHPAAGHPTQSPVHNVAALTVGSEHSLAITYDGNVIAWGWGEHGNCGEDVDEKGNVKQIWNTIFIPAIGQKVIGVAAGCATSFYWVEEEVDDLGEDKT